MSPAAHQPSCGGKPRSRVQYSAVWSRTSIVFARYCACGEDCTHRTLRFAERPCDYTAPHTTVRAAFANLFAWSKHTLNGLLMSVQWKEQDRE